MVAKVKYSASPATNDPAKVPVMVIGQLKNLKKINFGNVSSKLQPRVNEEVNSLNFPMLSYVIA